MAWTASGKVEAVTGCGWGFDELGEVAVRVAAGVPMRSIWPVNNLSGDAAEEKTANLMLEEPPLMVRMGGEVKWLFAMVVSL